MLEQHLPILEQHIQENEIRSVEDHHFATEMHAWNLQLLSQHEADQQRIKELEEKLSDAEKTSASAREYLPSAEEMRSMTRAQLDELERQQEEYLLNIRKIKVGFFGIECTHLSKLSSYR